jgi:hypothetical protein
MNGNLRQGDSDVKQDMVVSALMLTSAQTLLQQRLSVLSAALSSGSASKECLKEVDSVMRKYGGYLMGYSVSQPAKKPEGSFTEDEVKKLESTYALVSKAMEHYRKTGETTYVDGQTQTA